MRSIYLIWLSFIFSHNIFAAIEAIGDKQSQSIFILNNEKPETQGRKILSLDGGGIRGIYEAVLLAVMEELLIENNISHGLVDVFDTFGGTSTGSILAAGLVARKKGEDVPLYSALDLLKLYARYGKEIFDYHKRTGFGILSAKYTATGIEELLEYHFDDMKIADILSDKRLYILAFETQPQRTAIFSNAEPIDDRYTDIRRLGSGHLLRDAVRASAAAPVFFPAKRIDLGDEQNRNIVQMKDGGLAANNPAFLIYQEESLRSPDHGFEVVSLGTGKVTPRAVSDDDVGAKDVPALINDFMAGQVNTAEENALREVLRKDNALRIYARLNPTLAEGRDGLDDTRESNIAYAINKALGIAKSDTFLRTMQHLTGNKDLNAWNVTAAIAAVRTGLHSISTIDIDIMPKFEQRWLLEQLMALNLDLYKNLSVKSGFAPRQDVDQETAIEAMQKLITKGHELIPGGWAKWASDKLFFWSKDEGSVLKEKILTLMRYHGNATLMITKASIDRDLMPKLGDTQQTLDMLKTYKDEFLKLTESIDGKPPTDQGMLNLVAYIYWLHKLGDLFNGDLEMDEEQKTALPIHLVVAAQAFGKQFWESKAWLSRDLAQWLRKSRTNNLIYQLMEIAMSLLPSPANEDEKAKLEDKAKAIIKLWHPDLQKGWFGGDPYEDIYSKLFEEKFKIQ